MFFKTLEIQGFKSFPDKTVLSFDTKMTAIIGSNGNGKSNISDALRWVMGEQGAKTLRGDKMEDVIFHGTETRKQMGFASVVLSIQNSDRRLAFDSDEVRITRKLYRSGESEYLINNQKTRLKDIQELLMGTGLGRDGYSIIGQGRVAEIVNSKGKERREIFDEAAGVSKFLHKKSEAEKELVRAGENILRLLDISKELEDRLPTLERQSEKAVKAKALIEQEKGLDISVSIAELSVIENDMIEIDNNILLNEGECEHYEREIKELEIESENKSEEKLKLGAQMDDLRRFNENVKDRIASVDRESAVMEAEIIHNGERIKTICKQIENSLKSETELDNQISILKEEKEEKFNYLTEIKNNSELKKNELQNLTGGNKSLGLVSKELDKKLGELYSKQTENKISLNGAENFISEIENQIRDLEQGLDNRDEQIENYRIKRRELNTALEKLIIQKQENENKFNGFSKLFVTKKEKKETLEKELNQKRQEHDRKKSRFDVLSDVERNMAGYYGSVKAVINASKNKRISGIFGTVADIIQVDKKYGIAIETALGATLQNVIVENEETAKRCIRFLKEINGGRATFLPITSVKGRELGETALINEEGVLGEAHNLVVYEPKFSEIVKSILGRTVIADDIDSATYLAKKYNYRFKIVTLDGQVINAGGSFTGGSVKESAGIISRKQELETLESELTVLGANLEEFKANFSQLNAEINKMTIELDGYKERILAIHGEEKSLTAEIAGMDNLISEFEEEAENAELVLTRQKSQLKVKEAAIFEFKANLEKINSEIDDLDKIILEKNQEMEKSFTELDSLSEQITELNMDILGTEKDIENIEQKINSVIQNKENLGINTDNLRGEIKSLEEKNADLKIKIEETAIKVKEINKGYSEKQNEISEVMSKINLAEQRVIQLNKEIREKIENKEKFATALVLAKERKSNSTSKGEKIKSDLWEKYELTPTEAKNIASQPESIKDARNELLDIRRKISGLGNINFAAIEEFEEVKERYAKLSEQLKDLEKSKDALEKLIINLTDEIKEKFIASFNEINEHFGRIFNEIFGGGKAHLELTDPCDVLNSGIEIFAAPPGKLIKNLISLSGGEQTMVAITIYFAILLHRPTPFCMLDEVDAALDEINVVKYVNYLKRFSNNTQLMIITHRRGTIEGCDVLYGVFMQEKGVSRLLRQEIIDNLEEL